MSNSYFNHQELIKRTSTLLTKVFAMSARTYPRHVGKFYIRREKGGLINYIPIKINKTGMSDNWIVIKCYHVSDVLKQFPIPIHAEVESKTGTGELSEGQKDWKRKCERLGIWFFENRDENKLMKDIIKKANSLNLIIDEVNFEHIR